LPETSLFRSLKERKIVQWAVAYLAGAFVAVQLLDGVAEPLGLSQGVQQGILAILTGGFLVTLILAWYHGEKGRQRVSAVELLLVGSVSVASLFVAFQMSVEGPAPSSDAIGLDPERIAVLYFEDLSPAADLGYLADGITEELIDRLAAVEALDVISRNGTAPFRSAETSRVEVATALQAGTLIEGSVMPAGDRVRVQMYLVDGNSGADFERTNLEMSSGDLIAMRDSVADRLTDLLRGRLGEEFELRERRATTSSVDAWTLVQRGELARKEGEGLLEVGDVEEAFSSFDRADSILAHAEAADPQWVEPTLLRARVAYRRSRLGADLDEQLHFIDVSLEHVARALEIDPEDPRLLELRGTLTYWHWLLGVTPDPVESDRMLDSARADLERAVEEDGSLASAHSTLSHLYYQVDDDVPGALRAARRAYEEDAFLTVANEILWRLFLASFDLEQLTQAQQWCDEGYRRFPDFFRFTECRLWMMTTPLADPDVPTAWQLIEEMENLTPDPVREHQRHRGEMIVGGVLARAELADSARAVLLGAREGFDADPTGELLFIEAYIRTLLGDLDEAVELLDRLTAQEANPGDVIATDYWWWRDLLDHAGFRELVGITN
jgi:serine/threonine-protein kinase